MNKAIREAQDDRLAFSWLSTGMVNEHWSAYYAALGFRGRN